MAAPVTRYHGQAKRGQQPREQLNAQDLGWARQSLAAGETGLQLFSMPEVQALPRIQREGVKAAALRKLSQRAFPRREAGHVAAPADLGMRSGAYGGGSRATACSRPRTVTRRIVAAVSWGRVYHRRPWGCGRAWSACQRCGCRGREREPRKRFRARSPFGSWLAVPWRPNCGCCGDRRPGTLRSPPCRCWRSPDAGISPAGDRAESRGCDGSGSLHRSRRRIVHTGLHTLFCTEVTNRADQR
jgi:hypothetical protein